MRRGVDVVQQELRREKVREAWARGIRSISGIAKYADCDRGTVRCDLALLRRRAVKDPITETKLHLIRESVASGYESDISHLDELIRKACNDERITIETEKELETIIKTKEKKNGVDYQAISILFQRKMEARKKLAELYMLLEPENRSISVNASASAAASTEINLNGIPDADVINTAKGIFDRIAQTN